MMQMKDRNRLRTLQNKIIAKCEKIGYTDNIRISENMPADITLGKLRNIIYPEYENELNQILDILKKY